MPLDDLQFGYRGLTFGQGTDIYVNRAEGFEGFEVRSSDSDLPRGDGSLRGLDYVAARTIAFELAVIEILGGDTTYEEYWTQLRETFRPTRDGDYELTFKRPGMPERMVRCRPVQLVRREDYGRFNTVGFPPVVLRAVDPRIYSAESRTGNVLVYAASQGGFDLPTEVNGLDFPGGSQTEFVAENTGTADAYPLIRFYGPTTGTVTGVQLTNSTTGDVLEVAADIVTGQVLTVDMEAAATGANRLIVSLDGTSRYGDWQLPRSAFALAPGSNTIRFEVIGTSTDALCNLAWRDTWMD